MRRKLVAGNWKMHGMRSHLREVSAIAAAAKAHPQVDTLLCVPFTLIAAAAEIAPDFTIGAQDVHENDHGAHTGNVSAPMLVEAGAKVVIVGHSERRADQAETSHHAWAKAAAARRHGLPDGAAPDWLTVAYEPRWAIGTGKTPTLDEIATMHAILRAKLRGMIGPSANDMRILYGGSVSGTNAAAILAVDDVDGALVGGASLTADKFVPIIEAAAKIATAD